MTGGITTSGRVEYQYKTVGGFTVMFIEVKLGLGSKAERLKCIAQYIAEADGK